MWWRRQRLDLVHARPTVAKAMQIEGHGGGYCRFGEPPITRSWMRLRLLPVGRHRKLVIYGMFDYEHWAYELLSSV